MHNTTAKCEGHARRGGWLSVSAAALALLCGCAGKPDSLVTGFRNPPPPARPHVWWHWMSGNVSAEGARLDLEWMKRMGIGGVHAFAGGRLEPTLIEKPLSFMSPGWRDAYRQSVALARHLGMEVVIAGSPGWSQTGGPWVEPAQGMKKYVWSETVVEGGRPAGILPHPPTTVGQFQASPRALGFGPILPFQPAYGDAAVFAFPTPAGDARLVTHYSNQAAPMPDLGDLPGDLAGKVALPVPAGTEKPYVNMDFGKPTLVRSLILATSPRPRVEVLASDDGENFHSIATIAAESAEFPAPQHTYSLPATKARHLRVQFDRPQRPAPFPGRPRLAVPQPPITEITIRRLEATGAALVDHFEAKAGFQAVAQFQHGNPAGPDTSAIDPASVIDLSARMTPDGRLDWTPPPGRWTVVRLGWSLTGQANNPAEATATGLEVDKLDAGAVSGYLDKLIAFYEKQAGVPIGQAGIGSLLTDSWEAGAQNWTPAMLDEFERRRGYPAAHWLPVLTGRVVGNAQASDGFLFDFRRTLEDLVTDNHYGVLAKAAHARGLSYYTEAQGDAPRVIADGLTAKSRADIPTAEFWFRPFSTDPGQPPLVVDLQEAASAAHIYGKPLVAAESLTVAAGEDPWSFSPNMLKPVADAIFARGINRFIIHDSHHQPYVDRKPGLGLGYFGQYFNRNETWAEYARPWTDYLAANSYMLQQGDAVADIAWFYGEEQSLTQRYEHAFNTDVPRGYAFDYIDSQGVTNVLSVRDRKLATASGTTYQLLYIAPYVDRISLPVLASMERLVRNGAVLVGNRPKGGLGLAASDGEVRAMIDRIWGTQDTPMRHVGMGTVLATSDLAAAVNTLAMQSDLTMPADVDLMWAHRRAAGRDIYFLSNRQKRPIAPRLRFRAQGLPEWWTADDGRTTPLAFTREPDGSTTVDVPMEALGAGFVVFRPSPMAHREMATAGKVSITAIAGPWRVEFQEGRGAPASAEFGQLDDWSHSTDPGIRYFSGSARYSRTIDIEPDQARHGRRLLLDLGDVRELAVVYIDGKRIGTAWKAPFQLDLSGQVGAGRHQLTVEVVNLWVNRLIGDRQPGATQITYAPQSPYTATSPLLPSGLLGPVRLVSEPPEAPINH